MKKFGRMPLGRIISIGSRRIKKLSKKSTRLFKTLSATVIIVQGNPNRSKAIGLTSIAFALTKKIDSFLEF